MERRELIQNRITADLSEGVMVIRFDGVIEYVNSAALDILQKRGKPLEGLSFAQAFFSQDDRSNNDELLQCVMDAVYRKDRIHERYVPYRTEKTTRHLRVVSSYLRDGETDVAVILLISDVTELLELRDAMVAMEKIRSLNTQLEIRNRVLQQTFGRYLSDDIVREILDEPDGWKLGGQKRRLTVLMSDLRGFTAISERMPAQDLVTMLNHYFAVMYEEIARRRGTLIEFLGDGMLVVFGAPQQTDTHASDAVAAALGMQKRMEEVNRWNAERGYEPLAMGIGINTDDMILGNLGSEKRTKYGVLGAAVNLAGRIESCTTGGEVLISPNTREAIHEELTIGKTVPFTPKGVKESIVLSEVTGIGAPYGLFLEKTMPALRKLPAPFPVDFSLLEGKSIVTGGLKGSLLALSEEEALLNPGIAELHELDNICIALEGDMLYAKVTGEEDGCSRICFTAKPPQCSAWVKSILGNAEKNKNEQKRIAET